MKIFLCGITHNDYQNIEELTSVYDCFDGLIFVDGGSTDGTKELLETGHGYWEKYNLKEFYEPNKQKTKAEVQLAKEILDKEDI